MFIPTRAFSSTPFISGSYTPVTNRLTRRTILKHLLSLKSQKEKYGDKFKVIYLYDNIFLIPIKPTYHAMIFLLFHNSPITGYYTALSPWYMIVIKGPRET